MATSSDVRGLDEAVDAKSKKTLTPPSIKPEKAQVCIPILDLAESTTMLLSQATIQRSVACLCIKSQVSSK